MERCFMSTKEYKKYFDTGGIIAELDPLVKEQIRREAVLYKCRENELITEQNFFNGNRIWILLKGAINLVMRDEEGRTIVLMKITNSNSGFILPAECLSSLIYSIEVISVESTELCCIPELLSTQIFRRYTSVRQWKNQCYVETYMKLLDLINDLTFLSLKDRLYKRLIEYCDLYQANLILITHEQLADELATSREVISRLLKKMEAENLITISRKSIQVLE